MIPLVEVTRGTLVESVHMGAVAVVDATGALLAHAGDPELVTFLRSTAKPFQALPLLESGAAEHFGFDDRALAVMAASHAGTPMHVTLVGEILERLGLDASTLRCGAHAPYDEPSAQQLRAYGQAPDVLHNNCSGKHAGMLAQALHAGAELSGYLEPNHPVQQQILASLADLAGLREHEITLAVDGCSAPCFAMPLVAAARAFAQLGRPTRRSATRAAALARMSVAMTTHPELVAGPGRLDTRIMQATGGRVLSKGGAEGFHGLALRDQGLGVAFKITDGQGSRAAGPVAVALLDELGALDATARQALADVRCHPIRNHSGYEVGEVRPRFRLQRRSA